LASDTFSINAPLNIPVGKAIKPIPSKAIIPLNNLPALVIG